MPKPKPFVWRELIVKRPMSETVAVEMLRRIANDTSQPRIVLELRGDGDGLRLLLRARVDVVPLLDAAAVRTRPRDAISVAWTVKPRPANRAFASDPLEASTSEIYRAVSRAREGETAALQLFIGPRHHGSTANDGDAVASPTVVDQLFGMRPSRPERVVTDQIHQKRHQPGVAAVIRIGASAATPARERALIRGLHSALRRAEAPGVHLMAEAASGSSFDEAREPWWWSTRLTVREAAALSGLPIGEELPGLPPLHPVQLAPVVDTPTDIRGRVVLAEATAPGVRLPLSLSPDAVLRGVHLLGPVGVGKSDATAQVVVQWVNQGNAALVLEPKVDLSDAVASRIAPEHRDRLVYFDLLSEEGVIGLNPLRLGDQSPELVVDSLVSIFASVLSDVIGVTTRDLLQASLSSLVQYPGATLLMLPLLLSDLKFRRKVVANAAGDVFLQAYWAEFENRSEQARSQLVAPVLTRLRGLILRPSFRRCLGQAEPRFDVRQVLGAEKRVLLAPLPEAQLGRQGVALLGALLLHESFSAIRERAIWPPEQRHPVMFAVDEWHRFTHGNQDFAEALTLFRGWGAGFVLSNQVMSQLSSELRDVVTGTVRSRVYFQLGADDAVALSRHSPELDAIDLMRLEQFHIYAALYEQGRTQPFASGRTIQLPEPLIDPKQVRAEGHRRYGIPPAEVDRAIAELYGADATVPGDEGRPPPAIGRRPRTTDNS
ncbi:hypothetical protein [Microbacterium sp. S1037]|uniref:hypothetical protein n=1 Tax=Microbacterium sp. S1037 TaxID=3398227 RepID=UPI003AAF44F7